MSHFGNDSVIGLIFSDTERDRSRGLEEVMIMVDARSHGIIFILTCCTGSSEVQPTLSSSRPASRRIHTSS